MTGRFAFAGIHINAGLEDALNMANAEGGINGKKIEYIMEDGTYTMDVAVAAFKRIMSRDNPAVMYGESTALGKAMAPEIKDRYKVLYSSTSFSSELANAAENPYVFVPGPTYSDMFGILLKYIAKEKPGANVAFFYSDTEFGKDPIEYGREMCKTLGLNLVAEEVAKVGGLDVASQVLDLKRKKAEYVIFQGFVLSPVTRGHQAGAGLRVEGQVHGHLLGNPQDAVGQAGSPGRRLPGGHALCLLLSGRRSHDQKDPRVERKAPPGGQYRPTSYMQGFFTGLMFVECLKRADQMGAINGDNLAKALASIKDFDVGGLMAPVTVINNKVPMGRVYRANAAKDDFRADLRLDQHGVGAPGTLENWHTGLPMKWSGGVLV